MNPRLSFCLHSFAHLYLFCCWYLRAGSVNTVRPMQPSFPFQRSVSTAHCLATIAFHTTAGLCSGLEGQLDTHRLAPRTTFHSVHAGARPGLAFLTGCQAVAVDPGGTYCAVLLRFKTILLSSLNFSSLIQTKAVPLTFSKDTDF